MAGVKDREKIEAQAKKLYKKGKISEAIAEYRKLLSGDEQDIQIRTLLGDLYLESQQENKAAEEFKKIAELYEDKGLYSKATAIYKRIIKLKPDDIDSVRKLAIHLRNQGFTSEAKKEFLTVISILQKKNRIREAVDIYEELLKIDPEDFESRLTLAELYRKDNKLDMAIDALNDTAERLIRKNKIKEAGDILDQANSLAEDNLRTLTNLIEIYKKTNRKKEAMSLVDRILKKDKDNIKALYLQGNLLFEEGNFKGSETIFNKILSIRQNEVNAKIKLAHICLRDEDYDKAYNYLDPIVEALVKKNKTDKAIGLLGLILVTKKAHILTLERLAAIFDDENQIKNEELAFKAILNEHKRNNAKGKMISVLQRLTELAPDNKSYVTHLLTLRKEDSVADVLITKTKFEEKPEEAKEEKAEKGIDVTEKEEPVEEELLEEKAQEVETEKEEQPEEAALPEVKDISEEPPPVIEELPGEAIKVEPPKTFEFDEDDESVDALLAKADVYIEQGLIRVARRILENLRMNYPDDEKIQEKLEALSEQFARKVNIDEIQGKVVKISEKEAKLVEQVLSPEQKLASFPPKETIDEDKLTAADIFAETDIIPVVSQDDKQKEYFDLTERIEDELDAIKSIINYQIRGDTTIVEKALSDIVDEFRKALDEKVDKEDYESHYNLGIAFLEQGLYDEAIEECRLSARDSQFEVESYSVISYCYRQKKEYKEALKWLEMAVNALEPGSIQSFALKYEKASLLEDMEEKKKALEEYQEVMSWNADYRNVTDKVDSLRSEG
ncbi:MAG: tetratricopeptide repeat protein [Candidatus Aminicenantes bacterium]|nr:tetratricopeptide repeat protein [Candidatus Aminicenantes bacterium]